MEIFLIALGTVIAYFLGCTPVGPMIAKLYGGPDIRKTGSGGTGTTNVLRTLGWVPSVLTLVGDCLKGVLGALIGRWLGGEIGMLVTSLATVLGHDFPVTSHFKGGKGIATSFGVTLVVCTPVAPWLLLIVLPIVALTGLMSLGSVCASVAYPFLCMWLLPAEVNRPMYLAFAIIMALLSLFCHRANIWRLLHGQENRLDFKKISKLSEKYKNFKNKKQN